MMKGLLIALSGPSGVGKGTIYHELLNRRPDIAVSVSVTTRPPRPGEVNGNHYYFVSKERFKEMIDNGELLEHAETVSNMYGTPKAAVLNSLKRGADVILEIDVKGVRQIKSEYPECVSVFVLPPSFDELECRLRGRNTETEEQLACRLELAKSEIKESEWFDYRIVNDDVASAVSGVLKIIDAEKARRHNRCL